MNYYRVDVVRLSLFEGAWAGRHPNLGTSVRAFRKAVNPIREMEVWVSSVSGVAIELSKIVQRRQILGIDGADVRVSVSFSTRL